MDTKTQIKLRGARPVHAAAAGALCALSVMAALAPQRAHAQALTNRQKAVLLHQRLTGVPPAAADLDTMEQDLNSSNPAAAAQLATSKDPFYNVTLKNLFLPATNRDQSVFVPLNDYVVTAIGMVHDNLDFHTALSADILYTLNAAGLPPPSTSNNNHYATADANNVNIAQSLVKHTQTEIYGAGVAPAGLITTRASTSAFFINGTNRAMFRFTLIANLCRDMEQVQDATRPTDQIRQDVSVSPGGDSRVYLNTCISCHSGMDPMARAFAYYNFNATTGVTEYTPGTVNAKYFINSTNDKFGFVTPDDTWSNRWRAGPNASIGFDPNAPGTGTGAASLGQELASSDAFAACQVQKAFQAVCLRVPSSQADVNEVGAIKASFISSGYHLKQVFEDAAVYCTVTAP